MTQSSSLPKPGDVIDGRYRLEEVIGRGGMGAVFRAINLRTEHAVALKCVLPKVRDKHAVVDRFRREAKIAAALDHPGIVQCHDFGETADGHLFLVMEFLNGIDLRDILRDGPMSVARVVGLSVQLFDAVAEAHAAGIVHRDLKPGNILIERDRRDRERLKVLDFGMAKALDAADSNLTKTGQVVGTPSYFPPECIIGCEADEQGDIWACGLVMLEMLTGARIFDGELEGLIASILGDPIPIPTPIWDSPLGPIVVRCLQKDPQQRFPSADDALKALEAIAGTEFEDLTLPRGSTTGASGSLNSILIDLPRTDGGNIDLGRLPGPQQWPPDEADTLTDPMEPNTFLGHGGAARATPATAVFGPPALGSPKIIDPNEASRSHTSSPGVDLEEAFANALQEARAEATRATAEPEDAASADDRIHRLHSTPEADIKSALSHTLAEVAEEARSGPKMRDPVEKAKRERAARRAVLDGPEPLTPEELEKRKDAMRQYMKYDRALHSDQEESRLGRLLKTLTKVAIVVTIVGAAGYGFWEWHPWTTASEVTQSDDPDDICLDGRPAYRIDEHVVMFDVKLFRSKSSRICYGKQE